MRRTLEQIQEYLGLEPGVDNSVIIRTAQFIEWDYEEEILNNIVGYGLKGDYDVNRLEPYNYKLEPITQIGEIIIYKKIMEN